MTFWGGSGSGSGSADPCLRLMNPDPAIFVIDFAVFVIDLDIFVIDLDIFVIDLQDANIKLILFCFSAYFLLKVHLQYIIFQRQSVKRSHKIIGIKGLLTMCAKHTVLDYRRIWI
jgi:hypothetical protein